MTARQEQAKRLREGDRLYERYGKPLEQEHWGKYVAIFPDGTTVLGTTDLEAGQKALEQVGRGSFLFKVGEKVVFTFR